MKIGLIGDYDISVPAHQAIPKALNLIAENYNINIAYEWAPTEEIVNDGRIATFDGLWCVPASPYKSMDGALRAIQYARENKTPFLGTCGGFQHAIIEYARNVLGIKDAEHGETAPEGHSLVITPLACALVEKKDAVRFISDSKIAQAYGKSESFEGYRCRFGLNPEFEKRLFSSNLKISARDSSNEVRAIELIDHPFFIATLFQPERAALQGEIPPLAKAFINASCQQ